MSELQRYLREGGDPSGLGIKVRASVKHPALALFLYSHIHSPKGHPVTQQARGVILDMEDDFKIVARPFDRFFNYGEPDAAPIDWSTAKVYEKEDGSLISLYHYEGEWCVATKGEPDAGGTVGDSDTTFAELFWRVFYGAGYKLPPVGLEGLTFMFELCTQENRVVVSHPTARVQLLAVRDNKTGGETSPEAFAHLYAPVLLHELEADPESLQELFPILDPLRCEGFVVCDAGFRRLKIKHPGYLRLHRIKEGASPKAILDLVRTGEDAEFLTYFPEFAEQFAEARAALDGLIVHLHWAYNKCSDAGTQKEFAAAVRASGCVMPGVLFQMRKTPDVPSAEILAGVRINALMNAVEASAGC